MTDDVAHPAERKLSTAALAWALALGSRVVWSLAGAAATPFLKLDPKSIATNAFHEDVLPREAPLYPLLGALERFDSLWYRHVARAGYDLDAAIVFYPLYPALIRLTTPLCLGSDRMAALLVATLAACAAFVGLERLLRLDLPEDKVRGALVIAAAWPASFMLFAPYADGLVLALVAWSLVFARKERWVVAGALGLAAGLAKAVGALVLVPLVVLAWRRRSPRALPVLLAALGPALWMLWLRKSGFPTPNEVYARHWHTEVAAPWDTFLAVARELPSASEGLVLNVVLVALGVAAAFVKRARLEYSLYAAACFALFLTKKTDPLLQSSGRYVLAVFPAFVGASLLTPERALLPRALVLLVANAILFVAFLEWKLVV